MILLLLSFLKIFGIREALGFSTADGYELAFD